MYTCNFCSLTVHSLRDYVLHCRLHRNEPHAIFKCAAVDCKQSFSKYEAFKSHFYRGHNTYAHRVTDTALICNVALCGRQCSDVPGLVAHLKNHMKEGRAVNCPVRGCKYTFQIKSSFTSHMSRKHRNCSFNSIDHSHRQSAPEITSVSTEQYPAASDLDVNTVMDESQQRNVTSAIVRVLPDLSSSVLASVVETLNSLGVTTPEDFQYVQEADLLPVLRHIQARKLVSVLGQNQQSTGCGSTSAENSDSHLASCSSSSSHLVKVSKVPLDWADNFKIPWQKLPEEIIHCLEKKKRLSPRLRREMIRIVVSDMLKVCDGPSKQSSTTIAKKMVAKYPASLQDVIEGEIVGSGYHSLVKQLQNRVENIKRSYVPKIRKRNRTEDSDTDEIPGEKKAAVQDTYGCVNWELKLMPLSETKESQLDKQEQMKMMSTTANPDPEVVSSLLKATYYTQRRDINNGTSMQQLCETWPFLFREVGMCVHFKLLTGIDLKEMLFNSLDKKGKRLLNFLKTVGAERKKRVLQAAAKLEVMRGQIEGCSEDIKDLVLLLLAYFDEKEEMMFHYVEESCLVEDVQLDKLPATPCIVVCGSSCYTSKLFMVSIDQRITTPHISTFISAICIMFGSFYCFNIHYPLELGSTLEFLQRCFFSINPEKGTKVEWKKNKKQLPVNPRVLTLIADLADHEWRAD
nr:uncharacterized protein LOC129416852 isoform X2 [Misgurnus anguillicaudatus]XP_055039674.1 uncharacterized protein LOC129427310 isoform X3 [Misgurnus anguillicaudatus]